MDVLAMLQEYMIIPIVILALLTGYVLKHCISDETFENRWIPVVVTVEGMIVSLLITIFGGDPITANAILMAIISGGISGAASSGLKDGFSVYGLEHLYGGTTVEAFPGKAVDVAHHQPCLALRKPELRPLRYYVSDELVVLLARTLLEA